MKKIQINAYFVNVNGEIRLNELVLVRDNGSEVNWISDGQSRLVGYDDIFPGRRLAARKVIEEAIQHFPINEEDINRVVFYKRLNEDSVKLWSDWRPTNRKGSDFLEW